MKKDWRIFAAPPRELERKCSQLAFLMLEKEAEFGARAAGTAGEVGVR